MATNRELAEGNQIVLDVSAVNGSGTGNLVESGDPGAVGQIPFVALGDENTTSGEASVQTDGVYRLAVYGHDGSSNAAVAAGDIVYWDNTNGELDVDTGGVRFGYALEAVTSGATTTINVKVGY